MKKPKKRWTKSEHWGWMVALTRAVNRPLMGSPEHLFLGAWWHDLADAWTRRKDVPKFPFLHRRT
jgi:hypothetical protein